MPIGFRVYLDPTEPLSLGVVIYTVYHKREETTPKPLNPKPPKPLNPERGWAPWCPGSVMRETNSQV